MKKGAKKSDLRAIQEAAESKKPSTHEVLAASYILGQAEDEVEQEVFSKLLSNLPFIKSVR